MIGANRSQAMSHVWTVGRTEIRRQWRKLRDNPMQLLAIVIAIGFMGLFAMVGIGLLYAFGSGVASGEFEEPLEVARMGVVYVWIFITGLSGYQTYATGLDPDRSDGLLTTISHRELIGGLVVGKLLLWGVPAFVLGGIGALVFAAGAGSVATAPLLLVTFCSIVTLGILSGFVLALAVKNSGARSKLLARLRTVFLAILGVVYMGVFITNSVGSVLDPVVSIVVRTPLAWFGDLALLALSTDASVLRAFGAVGLVAVGVAIAPAVLGRLAEWLWYADPVRVDHYETKTEPTESGSSRLASVVSRPIYGVARVDWIRARRNPITLSFVLYPLMLLVMPITSTVRTGSVGGILPLLVGLSGAWITGSLFTLNVLGNEGASLPVTALGVSSGKTLVAGHVVAGVLVGVPVTVIATAALGIVSPMVLPLVGTYTLSALVLGLCAGPLASGIGTLFPRYEEVSVSRSQEAIIPSTIAFAVYSIALFLVAAPTMFAHTGLINDALADSLGVHPVVIGVLGAALSAAMAGCLGALSVFRSSRAIERFHFD
ncbi:hypothetical protein [Halostagnicola kamekurae]|uniref:ABC-2 type transport system permease protein n=1 Tax=Halostagnicola kamekurae TaxID=619731 RepID=A0A1I6SJK2_9EURY|nr:hypothetical protein [Halostagnicola kamekurae]SFS77103.1 hypothetical protein SAMN04488556_2726 [Halostagnicola kamekurae]